MFPYYSSAILIASGSVSSYPPEYITLSAALLNCSNYAFTVPVLLGSKLWKCWVAFFMREEIT